MFDCTPPCPRRLTGNLGALLLGRSLPPGLAAFETAETAQSNRSRVFARIDSFGQGLFVWHILTRRLVNNGLGKLAEVLTFAFSRAVSHHKERYIEHRDLSRKIRGQNNQTDPLPKNGKRTLGGDLSLCTAQRFAGVWSLPPDRCQPAEVTEEFKSDAQTRRKFLHLRITPKIAIPTKMDKG